MTGIIRIPLTQGQFALIDEADYHLVAGCRVGARRRSDGNGFYQRAALAALTAATEATLAYIEAMIDGKSPHHMGRIAKRMAAEGQQL